jgi:HupE / UreJ protein
MAPARRSKFCARPAGRRVGRPGSRSRATSAPACFTFSSAGISKGRWLPNEDLRASLKQVLLTITAFTLAHSITLTLATLQWVQLPPRLIESGIAISIVATAILNVYAPAGRHIWVLAFGFGLVHGFGFANALADSGLTGASMAWSLLGFNLGVEVGQLLFIAALWPPVWLLRDRHAFARVAMPMVSLALTLLGAAWFIERAFEIRILPG